MPSKLGVASSSLVSRSAARLRGDVARLPGCSRWGTSHSRSSWYLSRRGSTATAPGRPVRLSSPTTREPSGLQRSRVSAAAGAGCWWHASRGAAVVRGRKRGVERPEGWIDEKLAEQVGQLLPLRGGEPVKEALLVGEVVELRLVADAHSLLGEADQGSARIERIGSPLDESGCLEAVEPVGHGTGREHQLGIEGGRIHPVGWPGAAQNRQDLPLAEAEAMTGEDLGEAGRLEQIETRDPLGHARPNV